MLNNICILDNDAEIMLKRAFNAMGLSARGSSKILKIARTIADLEGENKIKSAHLAEALQFRNLSKKYPHLFSA